MSSKSDSPSNKSSAVSEGAEKNWPNKYIDGCCEICNIPVGKKNRPVHEEGKKHKNNLKKKLKRQGNTNNISVPINDNIEAEPIIHQTYNGNNKYNQTAPENSSQLDKAQSAEHSSLEIAAKNSKSANVTSPDKHKKMSDHPNKHQTMSDHPNKHQTMSDHPNKHKTMSDHPTKHKPMSDHATKHETMSDHANKHKTMSDHPTKRETMSDRPTKHQTTSDQSKSYRGGRFNRDYPQRPRTQQFQDPNSRWDHWHQRYQDVSNRDGYRNRYTERNGWHPPMNTRYRYFPKHGSSDERDMFFLDNQGNHNRQNSSDQNHFPFYEDSFLPLNSSDERERAKESDRDSVKSSSEARAQKKPLKRINESVQSKKDSPTVESRSGEDSNQNKVLAKSSEGAKTAKFLKEAKMAKFSKETKMAKFSEEAKMAKSSEGAKTAKSSEGEKTVKPKRINQSVRAIRSASTASRNSMDSDDSHPDGSSDKQSSKKNVPNESVSAGKRIAHFINPSNPKDEAELRRLVTNFSRSKKKENLVMLKQQSEDRSRTTSESFDADKCLSSPLSEDSSIEILEPSPDQVKPERVIPNLKRKSLNLDPDSDSRNSNSSKAASPRTSSGERKRKSQTDLFKPKKPRTSSNDIDSILDSVIRGDNDPKVSLDTSVSNAINQSLQALNKESTIATIMLKKEPVDTSETTPPPPNQLQQYLQNQDAIQPSSEATMTPVESLINLFATGNIKVKKEFDDPLIDAIRNLDPAVLNKVCDNQPSVNPAVTSPAVASPAQPLPIEPSPSPAPPPENLNAKPSHSVTMSLKAILKELEKISKKEKKIKENLQEADLKIHEYQVLLDEWKTKKLKFQSEEEILGHQRNTLVKSMNDLVTDDFTIPNFQEEDSVPESISIPPPSVNFLNNDSSTPTSQPVLSTESSNPTPQNVPEPVLPSTSIEKDTGSKAAQPNIEEEIAILPIPCKTENIPIIDLDDDDEHRDSNRTFLTEDALSDKLSNWKEISAHRVAVNEIEVFDGYIYTCSNDGKAKRFDLKDSSKTVSYQHEKKIVTHLCVEKIGGLTVLFTICPASLSISAFKAEDGTLLNTLNFQSSVVSICRGREKIYAGLRDGTIFTCNWKESKEIVNIGDTLRSIALTYQGCISILLTLAVNGNITIRDAERNGLLIRTAKSAKNVPLSMKVYGDCIYLSGSGHVIIVEIGSGKCVGQYEIAHPYTSLTPSHGYIFATSYSGLVRCYSQFGDKVVQVYYGAGKNSLTCIYIYNDWVFTGNRYGAVDVFKFNPQTCLPCQVGKCDLIFSREKDLEHHIFSGTDHDIPSGGSKCTWRTCRQTIPKNCGVEVIKSHIQEHIQALHFQDEQTLYNISV